MFASSKILVFASQKGGSGKSTLSGHTAVQALRAGLKVGLIDTDPQGSLAGWYKARENKGLEFRAGGPEYMDQFVTELREAGCDLIVVDTPPAVTAAIGEVVDYADMVVIPTRPSPHDLRAVGATCDIVERRGKALTFVVNSANRRARITSDAAVALSQHGTVAPVTVHHRVDFAASMIDGRTVMEVDADGKSAEEVTQLWDYLQQRLERLSISQPRNELEQPRVSFAAAHASQSETPAVRRHAPVFGRRYSA
ncbi:MAG: ParA family protein [Alphaproteobacteria bacterium]